LKFIVKLIEVPDIGEAEAHEFAIQAPNHITAIEQVIAEVGDDHLPLDVRSVAYVAERIDRTPQDEPAEIFFIRRVLQGGWQVIDGDDLRDATPEEAAALAAAGFEVGCFGLKNKNFRELVTRRKK
jgi:hypothetical protein